VSKRLVLAALDMSTDADGEKLDSPIQECIDRWGAVSLLDDTWLVDIGAVGSVEPDRNADLIARRRVSDLDFVCAVPGSDEIRPLGWVLSSNEWKEIVVVSMRQSPLSRITHSRAENEEDLRKRIHEYFPPDHPCRTAFFTLSWINSEDLFEHSIPRGYTSNFVHDTSIFVGDELAHAPFDESSRHLSLAFTGLLGAGGFAGQSQSPMMNVVSTDRALMVDAIVRPIRGIARAAVGGWFFKEALQLAMSRETFVMPSGVLDARPDPGTPIVLHNLVKETSEVCDFNYRPHQAAAPKTKSQGFFKALIDLIRDLPKYLREAPMQEVAAEFAKRVTPFADALQAIYGENSIIRIRGTSDTGVAVVTEVGELLHQLAQSEGNGRVGLDLQPNIEPATWRDFCLIATGSLDGSALPEGVTCLSRGPRLIFNNPNIVGPSPSSSVFELSKEDRAILGLSASSSRTEPDILDEDSIQQFRELCTKVKQNSLFSNLVPDNESNASTDNTASTPRGRLLGGLGSPRSEPRVKSSRDIKKILDDFEKWEPRAKELARESFFSRVGSHLQTEVDSASSDVKVEELKRLLDEIQKSFGKKKRSLFAPIIGGFAAAGAGLAFAASQLGWVRLALVPLLVFWLVVWLFSSALAFGIRVVRRAISNRQKDLEGRSESYLEALFNSTQQALKEYIRLRALQDQFRVWSRILREVIHEPYGKVSVDSLAIGSITQVPHPRQFAIVRVAPDKDQRQFLLNQIRQIVLVNGYLQNVLLGAIGGWSEKYKKFQLRGNSDPFADVNATWGQSLGQRENLEPIYFPLQDFFEDLVFRNLREETAQDLQREIELRFRDYDVAEVFGQITEVDPDHRALQGFSPERYLFEYLGRDQPPRSMMHSFSMDLFTIGTARGRELRQHNVDPRLSWRWDSQQKTLGSFNLRSERQFVMLTSMVVIGDQGTIRDLAGGPPERRPDSSGPTPRPKV
jgi:hypothetical protein